jgi:hypothetical protein
MAALMSNTSAIAFDGVTLGSISVWAFPVAADSKASSGVIYAAAGCKPEFTGHGTGSANSINIRAARVGSTGRRSMTAASGIDGRFRLSNGGSNNDP